MKKFTRVAAVCDRESRAGFTLLELLVSMLVLSFIVIILGEIVSHASSILQRVQGKVEMFREARVVFASISQRLSQATLNTYWAYDHPTSDADLLAPTKYIRQSELHFISGRAANLIPNGGGDVNPGHALFFQAPMGYSPANQGLGNLLNGCGYYVQFGEDSSFRPPFVTTPKHYRYRLMEFFQPSENLAVYLSGTGNDWFQAPITNKQSIRVLASNILMLVVLPRKSAAEISSTADLLSPNYTYDSRDKTSQGGIWDSVPPPLVDVMMVAIDEPSAARLEILHGSTPPITGAASPIINSAWFTDATQFGQDMASLRTALTAARLNYRIFTATIPIREAKWSSTH